MFPFSDGRITSSSSPLSSFSAILWAFFRLLLGTFARHRENTTVMMRRCDYDEKIEMLETGTIGKLRGDPTATQENSWSCKLKGLEKNQ